MSVFTEIKFESTLTCYNLAEGTCDFEGDTLYTITLKDGEPYGAAATVCPDCKLPAEDEGVCETYLDHRE